MSSNDLNDNLVQSMTNQIEINHKDKTISATKPCNLKNCMDHAIIEAKQMAHK